MACEYVFGDFDAENFRNKKNIRTFARHCKKSRYQRELLN